VDLDTVAQAFRSEGSLQKGRAAHSIYFEVLGDTGFAGLALYVAMLACAWLNTALVLAAARKRPDLDWADELARMLQVSLVGLMVGGAALSMAYYDGFMIVLMITAALLHVVRQPQDQTVRAAAKEPAWKVVAGQVPAAPAA
jgi:O-antigen ligase